MKLKEIFSQLIAEVIQFSEDKFDSFSSLSYEDLLKIGEWSFAGNFSDSAVCDETDNIEQASKLVSKR